MSADVNFCVHCRSDKDCPDCEAEAAPIRKAAQVAAIRQRLGDIAAGAMYAGAEVQHCAILDAASLTFGIAVPESGNYVMKPTTIGYREVNLDSLAAWLWERGVR